MERRLPTWLIARIASMVLSVPVWLQIRDEISGDFHSAPTWHFPLIIIGFSLLGVICVSVVRSDKEWTSPTWRDNPLDLSRPLQGLHLAAWSFIAGASALLLAGLLDAPFDWTWVLPGCLGVGLLAGIRIASIPEHQRGT